MHTGIRPKNFRKTEQKLFEQCSFATINLLKIGCNASSKTVTK